MVKLSKTVDSFEEIYYILRDAGYKDDVMGDMGSITDEHIAHLINNTTIDDMKMSLISHTSENLPGYSNPTFPNCINVNIGPFGFSYMKNGFGFGISVKTSKKGETKYIITFSFNKDTNYLKHSSVYNYAMQNEFNLLELTSKKIFKKN